MITLNTTATKSPAPMWAAYDECAIWGTGPTKAAALRDIAQWVNPEDVARTRRGCGVAIMTEALQEQVERGGSASGHALLFDGALGTLWERDDEIAEIQ